MVSLKKKDIIIIYFDRLKSEGSDIAYFYGVRPE